MLQLSCYPFSLLSLSLYYILHQSHRTSPFLWIFSHLSFHFYIIILFLLPPFLFQVSCQTQNQILHRKFLMCGDFYFMLCINLLFDCNLVLKLSVTYTVLKLFSMTCEVRSIGITISHHVFLTFRFSELPSF